MSPVCSKLERYFATNNQQSGNRLAHHRAIVTGAGAGIGRAVAFRLASEGEKVIVNDVIEDIAKQTAADIQTAGGEAAAVAGDVTIADTFERAFSTCESQWGQIGDPEIVHYCSAKAGIIGLTKALALEVGAKGVRVNAVAPGPINTELVLGLSQEWLDAKANDLPLGKFGEPEGVAGAVAFLASDDARIYVGQTLGPNSGDAML